MNSRDWAEKDFYQVLGVAKNASTDEIKKAYRKLARELHPDRNPGNQPAEERFKAVSEAYDVLSDDRQRREYDQMRSLFGPGGFRRGGSPGGNGTPFDFSDMFTGGGQTAAGGRFGAGGFGDIFSTLFTGGGPGAAGGASGATRGRAKGRDVETEVTLGFADAVRGVTLPLTLRAPGVCENCGGNGAKPGTSPKTCPKCRGTGLVNHEHGAFSMADRCSECQGSGSIVEHKCPECGGSGGVTKSRTLNVRIPAGVSDGQRIRLAGRGELGERGGTPGDLYVLINVRSDELFGRSGQDLTLTLPVTFAEATLGADLRVPTLDSVLTLRVPPGTPSGRTFRLRGRGVRKADGSAGDLLVTVEVQVPTDLSAAARAALAEFSQLANQRPRTKIEAVVRERETDSAPPAGGGTGSNKSSGGRRGR